MNVDFTRSCVSRGSQIGYQGLLIVSIILLLDQLSKFFVHHYIPNYEYYSYLYPYGGIGIFKDFLGIEFSITHMTNKGAAWGVLGDYQLPLVLLRLVLIMGTIVYLFLFNKRASWQIPLWLIVGGAIGNVMDYFIYGHVVDMFHFVLWGYDFPIFNVADSAISLGIMALFCLSCFES